MTTLENRKFKTILQRKFITIQDTGDLRNTVTSISDKIKTEIWYS